MEKHGSTKSGNYANVNNGNKTKTAKRRFMPWMIVVGCVLILMFVCFFLTYGAITKNNGGDVQVNKETVDFDDNNSIKVEIPRGASTAEIVKLLNEQGIIKYQWIFKLVSKLDGYDSMYQSGTHLIPKDPDRNDIFKVVSKYKEVMQILSSKPESIKVTISEGLTFKEIAQKLYEKKVVDIDKFINAANTGQFNYKFLQGLPKRDNRLEGYLFPDTYEFGLDAKDTDVVKTFLDNFNRKFKPEYYEQAKKLNMTVDQIVILASIIERESSNSDDRRTIAGVFYNRLRSKDPVMRKLQSCATVQYALLKRDGKYKEKLSIEDTKINDPYNTYVIDGLPPGPICSPSLDSIQAALNPADTDYMYFLSRGDGTTQFSKTFKEHDAAMKKYGLK